MNKWKEGARRNAAGDDCPNCHKSDVLVWDFKKFGQHTLVLCGNCDSIYVDGQLAAKVEGTA
jgi:hypothetical protein